MEYFVFAGFFLENIFEFLVNHFDGHFLVFTENYLYFQLKLKKNTACNRFLLSYENLEIAKLAYLW